MKEGSCQPVPVPEQTVPVLSGGGTLPGAAPDSPESTSPRNVPSWHGTHADGEHGPCPVHGVAVRPRADVSHVLPGTRQPQLPPHELGKRPHPTGAAADADELQ